jgi:hypothetical protein
MDACLIVPSEYKICKVVEEGILEVATKEGWRLIRVLVEQRVEVGGRYVNGTWCDSVPMSTTHLSYLVGLEEGGALALLNQQLGSVEDGARAAREKAVALEKELKTVKEALEASQKAHTVSSDLHTKLSKEHQDLKQRSTKMEADLGKIEKELGSAKMREILDPVFVLPDVSRT